MRRGNALLAIARADVALGLNREALDGLARIPLSDGSPVDRGLEAVVRGKAQQGLGHYAAALTELQVAENLLRRDANPRYLSWLYEVRSDAHAAAGDYATALADFREHIRLRDQVTANMAGQQAVLRNMEHAIATRAAENRALRKEKAALEQMRRWQVGTIATSVLLILLLGYVVMVQLKRGRRLRRLADFDALTHVASRASILSAGESVVAQAQADGTPMCVLTFDIDYFKMVNDTHGHPFGDEVLMEVAKACRRTLRPEDLLGRTGGEEFLVICPGAALPQAQVIAERMRHTVQVLPSAAPLEALASLTISVGLAQLHKGEDLKALVRRADHALYRAKRNGRNRVEAAD